MDHGTVPKTGRRVVIVISRDDVWKLPSYNHQVDSEGASREEEGIGQLKCELMLMDVNDRYRFLAQCINPKTANKRAEEFNLESLI